MSKSSFVTIIHTNDMHSHFENWPKIRRFVNEEEYKTSLDLNKDIIKVDVGDAIDLIEPLTQATFGKANVNLLNELHYDAVTIGNNEGLSLRHDELKNLYQDANFPITVANLLDLKTNEQPTWIKSVVYKTTKDGTRFALIGLTVPFIDSYTKRDWKILPVDKVLECVLMNVQKSSDVIVVLSHLGITKDRQLAEKFTQIDIIIGAHTHHLLENGELVNQTLLAAAGKWGRYVGKIDIELKNHKIYKKKAQVFETKILQEEKNDDYEIQKYDFLGKKLLQKDVIAKLPKDLLIDDGTLLNDLFKAITKIGNTPVAMLSTGLLLRDLNKGIVTKYDLLKTLPHQMYIMKTTLDGQNLKRLLLEVNKNNQFVSNFSMIGLGFRGKKVGKIKFFGIEYDINKNEYFYQNQPIKDKQNYQFMTLDYYKYLPFFPTIEIVGKNEILMKNMVREDFAEFLAKYYPI